MVPAYEHSPSRRVAGVAEPGPELSAIKPLFPQLCLLPLPLLSQLNRCFKVSKILQDSPSHRIFKRMYGALNIGKKITNYTVWL
jgi:hypothetical protein